MENPIMNQRPKHANEVYVPFQVRDNYSGIVLFEGSEKACRDYAEDEMGIIPAHLSIICIG